MKVRTRFYIFAVLLVVILLRADLLYAGWSEVDKLVAPDGAADDVFGFSVSVSGDYAIVGAYVDNSGSGSAYIFKRDGEVWNFQTKLGASDGDPGDLFGHSVSVSGDYAVIGAWNDNPKGDASGSAYIFAPNEVEPNNWDQIAKLIAPDGAAYDYFGYSVSASGDYAIIGAYGDDENGVDSGSAYIFKRDGAAWSQHAKLLALDGDSSDAFGISVCINSDYAIIGASIGDHNGVSCGSAYIFAPNEIDPNSWEQAAKLVASDGANGDAFGVSVSVSGDYAIVGSHGDDDNGMNSGSAYIFKFDGISWSEQAKLVALDGAGSDYFGNSVSVSGDHAIVGSHGDDDHGWLCGSAHTFRGDGTGWYRQDKLVSSDSVDDDQFGWAVSVSGDYAIVGAHGDDDNGDNSGSAYMFGWCPESDSTGDCFVDFRDLSVMGDEWLQSK